MADSSTDELKPPSATKGVLERFHMHIDKFREAQQDAIRNFLKGECVLVSQPTATVSEKFLIFSLSDHRRSR